MQVKANNNENQVINVSSAAQSRNKERAGRNSHSQNKNSIYAGDLGFCKDTVTLRKERAQKKALKLISDVWAGDQKIDQNIADIRTKVNELRADIDADWEIVNQGEAQKEALRQQYGVEADSQEQKDLELLEKEADMMRLGNGPEGVQLTEEEQARLEEIKDPVTGAYKISLTEYQKRCLDIDNSQSIYERRITDARQQIEAGYASIRGIKLERLKHHEMVDGQKKADEIMEQASKDVIGMLVDEAKDHVDETYEEQREEAKEKAEEKEEQEEKIEDRREEKEELEARIDEASAERHEAENARREQEKDAREGANLLENMAKAGMDVAGSSDVVQAEIKDMLHKMKLLEEDLKGAAVDEEV
ncbi:MAG: hypothetical protein J6K48_13840 [Lachnospiraceae bacterium]|nr:hypothetical protein [Lachnospiraceae bacterium]